MVFLSGEVRLNHPTTPLCPLDAHLPFDISPKPWLYSGTPAVILAMKLLCQTFQLIANLFNILLNRSGLLGQHQPVFPVSSHLDFDSPASFAQLCRGLLSIRLLW